MSASSTRSTAVDARPDVLVHTPHIGHLNDDAAAVKKIAGAGIPMTSTLQVFAPHFAPDNTPLFRDGEPFPWNTLSSAGDGPVNARLLWEAGILYGYGTDTTWPPKESLADELLIDGNPLTNINDLLRVMVTIKDGRIVSDARTRNGRAIK